MLQYVIAFLVVLAIVIVVHELGHYWVARWCGVKILRFSVGFGKVLLMVRRGPDQTEWALSAIPFGGYVKMLDGREGAVAASERHRAFDQQTVGKRMAIVVAGPAANFILAFVVYVGMHLHGIEERRAIVTVPSSESVAARAGFGEREEIRAIDGREVGSMRDAHMMLIARVVDQSVVTVTTTDARGQVHNRRLDLAGLELDSRRGDPLSVIGLAPWEPPLRPVIGVVEAGAPAALAGLQVGDRIVAVDGERVDDWYTGFVKRVMASHGRPLRVDVDRNGSVVRLDITPLAMTQESGGFFAWIRSLFADADTPVAPVPAIGRVGAGVQRDAARHEELTVIKTFGLIGAMGASAAKTWEMSVFSLEMLWKMLVGKLSWRNLGGPIAIADYAGKSAALGAKAYILFIALVSISIGILNLLPIPILDGGHLLYYLVEFVKGSPLSDRIMEAGQRVGFAILILLMGFALYNDITSRLIPG